MRKERETSKEVEWIERKLREKEKEEKGKEGKGRC